MKVIKGTTCLILVIPCCPDAALEVGLPIPPHLAFICNNIYNQANNGYGNITPTHENKQRKIILCACHTRF
jgi:hypothetical protein